MLGIRQLGLAGWAPAECLALENELGAWQAAGGLQARENGLRCAPHCCKRRDCGAALSMSWSDS